MLSETICSPFHSVSLPEFTRFSSFPNENGNPFEYEFSFFFYRLFLNVYNSFKGFQFALL